MGDWAKQVMKQVESGVREQMKKVIEDRLKPLQSEIRREGARVKIVPKPQLEKPFSVSIDGASEELTAKIQKALAGK